MRKTRPCLIVSPDDINEHLRTVIVAPLTSRGKAHPYRIPCAFAGKDALVILDQLRTVDKARLFRRMGRLDEGTSSAVLASLQEMFAP